MAARHKVFVSYHHANDENYKNIFNLKFGNKHDILVRGSVELGDIDPNVQTETIRRTIRDNYLRDTSVTVVLVGTQTWQRKHVDWEISSSIRNTAANPRSGLLGILLPSFMQAYGHSVRTDSLGNVLAYDPFVVPPRLHDNVACGYARLYTWTEDPEVLAGRLHEAYLAKHRILVEPNNARTLFARNRSGDRWTD